VTSAAAAERAALCELLDKLGPDAPTLCEGWTTYDLAAHLAVRDRKPAAWPGIALPRLADRTEELQQRFRAEHPYPECVELVRQGAPVWSPMGAPGLRDVINLIEFVVHHEDVRRAQPGWAPRAVPTSLADGVWSALRFSAKATFRHAPDGVMLARAGSDARISARRGRLTITVTGDPIELALYSTGRRSVARVEVRGDDAAIARLAATKLAL
jgi:uncharacterized protein (TIGR03085 family)